EIIADQESRLHRSGRNIERLEKECADDKCNQEGVKNHAPGLGNSAFFSFCSGSHAHVPLVLLNATHAAAAPSRRPRPLVQENRRSFSVLTYRRVPARTPPRAGIGASL